MYLNLKNNHPFFKKSNPSLMLDHGYIYVDSVDFKLN